MSDDNIKKLIISNEILIEQNKYLVHEVNELKKTCSRMDNHISFVENTYNIIRHPLNWFINKWYRFYGYLTLSKVTPLEFHESISE